MAGEIGSLQEGPGLNEPAPDFELKPLGGGEPVRLSKRLGGKPIVLVFGNFTCGPFRSMYSTVEAVRERQKDNADFLFIYVREAHPTDGWAMKSNEKSESPWLNRRHTKNAAQSPNNARQAQAIDSAAR